MYDSSSDEDDTPKLTALQGEENFEVWEFFCHMLPRGPWPRWVHQGHGETPVGDAPEDIKKLESFKNRKWRAWNFMYKSVQSFVARKDIHIYGYGPYNQLELYDPKLLWDELQRWYTKVGPGRQLDFLRELTSIDYRQFNDLDAFLDRVEWLQRRLGRLGMPILDVMMKICLFGSLIKHHRNGLQTLLITRYDELDSQKLILRISQHKDLFQRQANEQRREQQGTNRRRNTNGSLPDIAAAHGNAVVANEKATSI